jgi:valyl-tRNA synthetase
MSKTKGNVVDPLETINENGADALRFALIHGATPGNDQRFGQTKLENARNFANKLWNAARFVLGSRPASVPSEAGRQAPDEVRLGAAERWILSRAAATTAAVDRGMADYTFGEVTRLLYDSIWNEYCDWGIELAKVRLADESLPAETREATWWALVEALDTYLRLLQPVMPFVTEAIWDALPHAAHDPQLLIAARWPSATGQDESLERAVGRVIETIVEIRNARATAKLPAGGWLETHVSVPAALAPTFSELKPAMARLARARPFELVRSRDELPVDEGLVEVVLAGGEIEAVIRPVAFDASTVASERARLEKDLAAAERLLQATRDRLASEAFTSKAPPAIVDGARAREAELAEQVRRLGERLGN